MEKPSVICRQCGSAMWKTKKDSFDACGVSDGIQAEKGMEM